MSLLFISILLLVIPSFGQVEKVSEILTNTKLVNDAKIGRLKLLLESAPREQLAMVETALAELYVKEARYQEAVNLPDRRAGILVEFSWYYRAQAHLGLEQYRKAISLYDRVKKSRVNRRLRYLARMEMADAQMKLKHYRSARKNLRYLERRMRGDEKYPEVLYSLVDVEKKNRNSWRACRWAKKLHSKYPIHPLVKDWPLNLRKAEVQGRRLGCSTNLKHKKKRIRRLLLNGADEQAHLEQAELRASVGDKFGQDSVQAEFLLHTGEIPQALNRLLPYYDSKKEDGTYLYLLARTAAKMGQTQLATFAYLKAHELSPRSSRGRKALFNAAVLNYQYQNYDLSLQLFEKFQPMFARFRQGRDAMWYIGWIRYLRGDHQHAIAHFEHILSKIKRRHRGWRHMETDRFEYWRGMALLRDGQTKKAKEQFDQVGEQRLKTFYYLLAEERMRQLGGQMSERKAPLLLDRNVASVEPEDDSEDEEVTEEDSDNVELAQEVVNEEDEEDVEEEEFEVPTVFRSDRLQRHFMYSQVLAQMGWMTFAKWELYEVERNTSKKDYLQVLVDQYTDMEFFNRSAYLAQIYFGNDRRRYGISGVRHLWEAAYPKAYDPIVSENAKNYGISPLLIWSIMRAETIYRADAVSPVGAMGLMQVMPYTGARLATLVNDQEFDQNNLLQPEYAIRYGGYYLSRLSRQFEGEVPMIAGAYNAGPHRMKGWLKSFGNLDMDEFIEHIPFRETRGYVKRVVRNYQVYSDLYQVEQGELAVGRPGRAKWRGPVPLVEDWN